MELFLGFMWGFFLSGSAMILNDYFDIEVDKVNAPNRPLPSGLISSSTAIVFTSITIILGGIVVGNPWNKAVMIFSMMLFIFDLGEEIAADCTLVVFLDFF